MIKYKLIVFLLFIFVFSCKQIEILDEITFDNSKLDKIKISAQKIYINNLYDPIYNEPYIDYSVKNPPIDFLTKWLTNNISLIGNENKLKINILNSSLKKSEILNYDLKKFKENKIFLYEVNYLVEFILYNDSNSLLANTIIEVKRTTTSGMYISIQENDKIIDYLIYDSVSDFSKKANELINIYFKEFII